MDPDIGHSLDNISSKYMALNTDYYLEEEPEEEKDLEGSEEDLIQFEVEDRSHDWLTRFLNSIL